MRHDRLCLFDAPPFVCICERLTAARADEREQAGRRVMALDRHAFLQVPHMDFFIAVDAVAAARGEDEK